MPALGRDDVQEIAISLPRGAGKSTFLGTIGAAAVLGPLARPNGESAVVAASTKQARAVCSQAHAFVEQLRPGLKGLRYMNAHYGAFVKDEDTGASLATISSDPKKAHGLRPVFIIADEPSSWSAGWGAEMMSVLQTALGKASFAKLVLIGTRSADPEHFFSRALDGESDQVVFRCYEGKGWADDVQAALVAAHPDVARPEFATLLARCVKEGKQATRDPTAAASFRALRLNAGVEPTPQKMLIDSDVWLGIEVDEADLPARDGPSHWGIDLGNAKAMSGVAAYWPETGRLEAAGWFPGDPSLTERRRADNVADRYERMRAAVELHSGCSSPASAALPGHGRSSGAGP